MSDYISREEAIERLKEERNYTGKYSFEEEHAWAIGFHQGISFALSDIASLPAADVRPVVLCKDCMYAPSGTDGGEDQGFSLEWPHDEWPEDNPCPCKCEDGWYSHKPKPDFFCANGKRGES